MAGKYDHKEVEKKWQKIWEESQAFAAPENPGDKKDYILAMFPYPSGEGIHLGHTENYTATDIYSRFKRMQGKGVLHPIGWDAFGLPAENYAIKTGTPPQETTDRAIQNFRRQLKSLGLSFDWAREVGTHTPQYYMWTQWFFLFLLKNGLAEKRMAKVNWCPKDQTVLANEQTVSESGEKGVCVRCGTKVVQKDLKQWFFKITDFADALVDDLDTVDWPESTKINQRNWIGRSEGSEIEFGVKSHEARADAKIKVFTTRADTLFGATYMVLAPEHPLIVTLASSILNLDEVNTYINEAKNKTDLERQEQEKNKTGVELKGIKAINPANGEEIPVYVADYVLWGYGTGAIMAVPAHDERDYAFAKKFNIAIRQVIEPTYTQTTEPGIPKEGMPYDQREAIIAIVKHWAEDKYIALKWKQVAWGTFITGGIEAGQTPETAALAELKEEVGYTDAKFIKDFGVVHGKFYHVPKKTNRNAHAHVVYLELQSDARTEVSNEESAIHEVMWLSADELKNFLTPPTHQHGLRWLLGQQDIDTSDGTLCNSGQFDRMESEEARKKITDAVGGKLVKTYRLRDWLISRQRYWGAPIPVVYDLEGKPHPVPEEHLPWLLPTDAEFLPHGTSPLATSKELLERTERIFGKGWTPDVDTMDTFVCSSWYYFRFADPHNAGEFASLEKIKEWLPVDLYMGGAEHTVLHLMYARFFTKALKKHGVIGFDEPFLKLRHQGLILAEDGTKMSKSKGNVVNPDDVIKDYGADALRLYIMFMGPLEAMKPWNTKGINGVSRFLERTWAMQDKLGDTAMPADVEILLNQTIAKATADMEALKFNTVISALMILLNALAELPQVPRGAYVVLLQLLAPLAPHIVHEIAENIGLTSGQWEQWPTADASKLLADTATIGVQVNGKVRGTITVPLSASEEDVLAQARAEVGKWLDDKEVKKALYIKGKIVTLVVV